MYTQQEYNVHFQRVRTVYAKVEILNTSDIKVDEIVSEVIDGSITLEAESAIRRTLSMKFKCKNNFLPTPTSPLWGNKRIRLYIGIKDIFTDEIVWFKMGIFILATPEVANTNTDKSISIKGYDKMCLYTGDISGYLINTLKVTAGTPIRQAIQSTVTDIIHETNYIIDDVLDENNVTLTVPYDIEKTYADNVWSMISELNNLYMYYQSYYDVDGIFRFNKRPNRTNDAIIWDFTDRDFRIDCKNTINYNNIRNHIKVYGGVQNDESQPSAEVSLTNADSSTSPYTIERWGERKLVISEDKYGTNDMCLQRAKYELWLHTNLQEYIDVTCLPIYMLDINSVVHFDSEEDGVVGNYLITSMTIPLKPSDNMTFKAYKIYD